jgi:hypothetical protein
MAEKPYQVTASCQPLYTTMPAMLHSPTQSNTTTDFTVFDNKVILPLSYKVTRDHRRLTAMPLALSGTPTNQQTTHSHRHQAHTY